MRSCQSTVFMVLAIALGVMPAAAQHANVAEVTPYVALGLDSTIPVGAAVTIPVTSTLSLETDASIRRSEGLPAVGLNTSLVWLLPRVGYATPYLAGGVGLSQFRALAYSYNGGPMIGGEQRVALTMNVGGGLKMPMSEKLDLRTDVRWFNSVGNAGFELFRVAQGIGFDVGKR